MLCIIKYGEIKMEKTMKKYITMLIVMMMLVLVSCSKDEPGDIIKVWMYKYSDDAEDNELKELIKNEVINFSEENNLKVDIIEYSYKEMSVEDYIFKRNLALETKDADIVIDCMNDGLEKISQYAGDYTKLKNYENIFDNFKGQYCIPISSLMKTIILDNSTLKQYGFECDKYITLDEYYELKQKLKEKGAKFRFSITEQMQLFNYYISKNDVEMIKNNGVYTIDKELVMNTIKEIYEDIQKHYDIVVDKDKGIGIVNNEEVIYDETSGCHLSQRGIYYPLKISSLTGNMNAPYEDFTVVIRDDIEDTMRYVPCLFINKNTKNDDTYNLADFLISDTFQKRVFNNTVVSSTIVDTAEVKEKTGYNDDWSYKYEQGVTKIYNQTLTKNDIDGIIKAVQKSYEIFKNIDTKKFYTPLEYKIEVGDFIIRETFKMIDNPNYDEAEFNKNADEFLTKFNVQYN